MKKLRAYHSSALLTSSPSSASSSETSNPASLSLALSFLRLLLTSSNRTNRSSCSFSTSFRFSSDTCSWNDSEVTWSCEGVSYIPDQLGMCRWWTAERFTWWVAAPNASFNLFRRVSISCDWLRIRSRRDDTNIAISAFCPVAGFVSDVTTRSLTRNKRTRRRR